jgi:hypothetical protein
MESTGVHEDSLGTLQRSIRSLRIPSLSALALLVNCQQYSSRCTSHIKLLQEI